MELDDAALKSLAAKIDGSLVTPDDPSYDVVRQVWNGSIDRRPAVIVRCASAYDVGHALRFAKETGLRVTVRSGGHSMAGLSICDDGLMIDLSPMKGVRVDTEARRAFAQAGLLGGELDRATQEFGLATTLGTVSHTGIAGLTLGGGMGWLMRRHGLACDNVLSVEAVLADGSVVHANPTEHPDLFWALRGGGGSFAIVTEFEYALYPVGPQIALTQMLFSPADGFEALRLARDLGRDASADRDLFLGHTRLPDAPQLPAELRGTPAYLVIGFSADLADADGAWMAPLDALRPVLKMSRPYPYVKLQAMYDEENRPGVRAYSKGAFIEDLSDDAIATFVEYAPQYSDDALVYVQQMGGAVTAPIDSAAQGRGADYVLNIIARWSDEANAPMARQWARSFAEAMKPFALPAHPLNFEGDVFTGFPDEAQPNSDGYARLRAVKRAYDPAGVLGSTQRPH